MSQSQPLWFRNGLRYTFSRKFVILFKKPPTTGNELIKICIERNERIERYKPNLILQDFINHPKSLLNSTNLAYLVCYHDIVGRFINFIYYVYYV
ncbi:hypothetical protein Glove_99g61 [Diversispora epigaea]|uniref:Uncharacterized protein n=1 Tax=Diversispora epigaea TaxID=1348612 RepID=A0A397J6U3_9GLOM|nr:hypothetical protein Glove_99g61 [Diversispora epigaea]